MWCLSAALRPPCTWVAALLNKTPRFVYHPQHKIVSLDGAAPLAHTHPATCTQVAHRRRVALERTARASACGTVTTPSRSRPRCARACTYATALGGGARAALRVAEAHAALRAHLRHVRARRPTGAAGVTSPYVPWQRRARAPRPHTRARHAPWMVHGAQLPCTPRRRGVRAPARGLYTGLGARALRFAFATALLRARARCRVCCYMLLRNNLRLCCSLTFGFELLSVGHCRPPCA